ncbi:MAG TPA: hypothetical protein VME24_01950, partial [Alphaproteobacteria bacterium]|nr:hypothetical protein [Alphaproteobacteria bacterium]
MQYYVIVPQGYGQLGERTVVDRHSGEIIKVEVMLEHVPEDELTEVGGDIYLASIVLAKALAENYPTCFDFEGTTVCKAPQMAKRIKTLPEFVWLKIRGIGLKDDFGLLNNRLVISETALEFLRQFKIRESEVTRFEDFPFSWEERKRQLYERARQKLKEIGPPKKFPFND